MGGSFVHKWDRWLILSRMHIPRIVDLLGFAFVNGFT